MYMGIPCVVSIGKGCSRMMGMSINATLWGRIPWTTSISKTITPGRAKVIWRKREKTDREKENKEEGRVDRVGKKRKAAKGRNKQKVRQKHNRWNSKEAKNKRRNKLQKEEEEGPVSIEIVSIISFLNLSK